MIILPIDIFIVRLSAAMLCGLIIGIERQLRHKMSAVVTNVLVCMGSFLFLSFAMNDSANEQARLASQVISGIGFLGGGVIIRDGFSINNDIDNAARFFYLRKTAFRGMLRYNSKGKFNIR